MKKSIHKISSPGEPALWAFLKFAGFLCSKPGIELLIRRSKRLPQQFGLAGKHEQSYYDWVVSRTESPQAIKKMTEEISSTPHQIKFTVIVTIDEHAHRFANLALQSLSNQVWPNREISILCPANYENELNKLHSIYFASGEKTSINYFNNPKEKVLSFRNIISSASGEYMLIFDTSDVLAPGYLFEVAKYISQHGQTQLIYTDSDEINLLKNDNSGDHAPKTVYSNPFFKPDWSPDNLLSGNYIGNTFLLHSSFLKQLIEANIAIEAGGYGLLLLASESLRHVGHIPYVLCHQAQIKSQDHRTLLENTIARRGYVGSVVEVKNNPDLFNVDYAISRPGKVSIIIPSKDNAALLRTTLNSIIELSSYKDYEIILLNNNSTSTEFYDLIAEYNAKYSSSFRCVEASFPFNFSKLINLGVAESKGDYILMLNNDVEILQNDWLEKMIGYAQLPHIGAVGAQLLFPDDTIQHAGIVTGVGEATAHAFIHQPTQSDIHFNYIQSINNCSAVTAACLMVRKEAFSRAGGMDESLPVEFNDVDFCMTLGKLGYYNVYLPFVRLYHYESATRGHPFKSLAAWKQHKRDLDHFTEKWGSTVDNDPFYNRNLSADHTDFRQKRRLKRQ